MRPLSLKGHERPITRMRVNRDGDLLFSAAKDKSPSVWFLENGERLGTYDGHNGVVWDLDVTFDTANIVTASGDNSCRLWDCQTGKEIGVIGTQSTARAVGFSYSSCMYFLTTAKQMQQQSTLSLFDIRQTGGDDGEEGGGPTPFLQIPLSQQANCGVWSQLDNCVIVGDEKGGVTMYDIRRGDKEPCNFSSPHRYAVTDLQLSADQTMLISSSKDKSAKLHDAVTLEEKKLYKSDRPVNSAAISPIRDHVVLGGGEEAMNVTTTTTSGFEARFYHLVFEDEFARVKGHFGPINSLVFHPDGRSYMSGSEDGYMRIQSFDDEYFEFDFDY